MYVRSSAYLGSSPLVMSQRLADNSITAVDARTLPGGAERAERLIDSLVTTTAGRKSGVKGYTANAERQQDQAEAISTIIARLPASTSQKERDAWNAKLAEINNDIAYARGQANFYASLANSDPARDPALNFAAKLLGVSVEDAVRIYNDKTAALEAVTPPTTSSDGAATGAREWGWDPSGLRAEIKVNGEVVGRIYNSGTVELADDYGAVATALFSGPGEEGLEGPNLAEHRIGKLGQIFGDAKIEVIRASTALTQAQWAAQQTGGNSRFDYSV